MGKHRSHHDLIGAGQLIDDIIDPGMPVPHERHHRMPQFGAQPHRQGFAVHGQGRASACLREKIPVAGRGTAHPSRNDDLVHQYPADRVGHAHHVRIIEELRQVLLHCGLVGAVGSTGVDEQRYSAGHVGLLRS